MSLELDAEEIVGRGRQGRDAWLREGKRQLEQHRWDDPDPVSRSREERLLLAVERLEDDLAAERAAMRRMRPTASRGGCATVVASAARPNPHQPPEVPEGKVNVTDPDSRPIPIGFGFVQGYNAQTAVNEQQIVLAAEITNLSTDFSQLSPMVDAVLRELGRAGIAASCSTRSPPTPATGTSSRWTTSSTTGTSRCWSRPTRAAATPPSAGRTASAPTGCDTCSNQSDGRERYGKRKQTVEPLYGDTKHNKGFIRFHRRGRMKVRTEFRLLMMAHNLTKVHRHQIATVGA